MTNTDLVKRLLDEDVLPYLSPEQVIDLCSDAAAAIIGLGSANKALKARLATIEAATVERCAAEIQAKCQVCNGTGHQGQDQCPYCGYPIDAIRALAAPDTEVPEFHYPLDAAPDTEALVERVAIALHDDDWGGFEHIWADTIESTKNAYRRNARAVLAAMGVGR